MWLIGGSRMLKEVVQEAVEKHVNDASAEAKKFLSRYRTAAELEKKITELEIVRDRKQEEWDRREREIEHKVGLERKRQEFEIVQAKRDTTVTVREENLAADKERFKGEMDFQRQRLEQEVGALRTLVGQMLERLPSAEIYASLGGGRDKK